MGLPASIVGQIHTRGIPYLITLLDYWFPCANAQLITNYDNTLCVGPDARWHNCGRCALARAGLNQLEQLAPAVAPLMAYRHRLLYKVFRHASHILAPNEFVREIHASAGFPTERVVIVPFGTDGSAADLEAARMAAAQRPATGLRIGYVGSIAWQKGVDCLVAAVNQLPHEGVTLSIYGDLSAFPDYVTKLRCLAQHPGIHFDGALSRQRLWPILGGLDVLVVPSVWYEGSPFIVREAFAAGVPVIASRIGALPEMVRDGVNGLLFPPGDAAALHVALRTLLDNPTQLARLRANVPSILSFGEHVRMVTAMYDETIQTG
jgi:glycosyltransferase involved in cell wall biosynthesis